MRVLNLLAEEPQTPSEISRRLDTHRSTALRIMEVLADQRLIRRLPDGRYGIGPGLITLAQRALDQFTVVQLARPHLVQLSELYDQTVHLAERHDDHIVYTDKIEPKRSIRLVSRVGENVRLHTAAVAKAILAFLPPVTRTRLLANADFTRYTDTTITSADELLGVLAEVAARGWAIDNGEYEDYITSLAAPIRDASGDVVAAISVIELKAVSTAEELENNILQPLLDTAATISTELGWSPDESETTPPTAASSYPLT
ncbi:IclR family transcriptional regulator [Rhodococcus wratislaviensis]